MHHFLELVVYYASFLFDLVGLSLVVWGGIIAIVGIAKKQYSIFHKSRIKIIELENSYRREFAAKLILALEFFLAIDIMKTVVSPTWDALGMLAALVVIRTVLTYFLNKEIKEYK